MKPYHWKIFFETELKIGAGLQPMDLLIDTGAAWTWLEVDECKKGKKCNANVFHPALSSSYKETPLSFDLINGTQK